MTLITRLHGMYGIARTGKKKALVKHRVEFRRRLMNCNDQSGIPIHRDAFQSFDDSDGSGGIETFNT